MICIIYARGWGYILQYHILSIPLKELQFYFLVLLVAIARMSLLGQMLPNFNCKKSVSSLTLAGGGMHDTVTAASGNVTVRSAQ